MTFATMDTHEVVKELKAAGFTDEQAEAVTRAVRRGQEIDLSSLATKADLAELKVATRADLAELKAATKADLAELRAATKADLAELKADILKWMFGTIGFQTFIILGAVVALSRAALH